MLFVYNITTANDDDREVPLARQISTTVAASFQARKSSLTHSSLGDAGVRASRLAKAVGKTSFKKTSLKLRKVEAAWKQSMIDERLHFEPSEAIETNQNLVYKSGKRNWGAFLSCYQDP